MVLEAAPTEKRHYVKYVTVSHILHDLGMIWNMLREGVTQETHARTD